MLKHIVVWDVRGDAAAARGRHIAQVAAAFGLLRGRVPGLLHVDLGVDESRIAYACNVVLYTEFESREALAAYVEHPEHLRVRRTLGDLRTARFQVDYEIQPEAGRAHADPDSARKTGDHDHVQAV
jgi:heme-degrading monooxygenase HmoA